MSSNESGPRKRKARSDQNIMMAFLGVGLSVAVEIAVATTIGWYAGKWLDEKMGWEPYGMFVGVVLFLTASMTHTIIVLNHLNKKINSDK